MKKSKTIALGVLIFLLIVLFLKLQQKEPSISIKNDKADAYIKGYNYFDDYNQGLLYAKSREINILLIF
jgi:hypothetical protein